MDITTRTKIDAIWQGMWDNGMADAKTNITQITYLLFIKMLDDAQLKKEANANAFGIKVKNPTFKEGVYIQNDEITVTYEDLRWHNFVHYSTEKMYTIVKDYVFKFIREMHNGENNAFARFMTDAKLDIPSGKILEKVIRGLDDNELNLDSLNEKDLSELQEVLNSLKNPVDNTENFNNTQELIIFIRKIIGLDKKAIDEKCAKFLNNNDFNKEQRQLINLIIDFAIRNGNVTAEDLVNEQPFCDIPIQEMFDFDIRPLIQLVNVFNSPLIVSAAA